MSVTGTTRTLAMGGLLTLAAFGVGACQCGEDPAATADAPTDGAAAPTSDRPNVLVIVWDTTRADRLGPYGYELETTPHLDEFAKDAVVYERAVSPGMWARSVMAM